PLGVAAAHLGVTQRHAPLLAGALLLAGTLLRQGRRPAHLSLLRVRRGRAGHRCAVVVRGVLLTLVGGLVGGPALLGRLLAFGVDLLTGPGELLSPLLVLRRPREHRRTMGSAGGGG